MSGLGNRVDFNNREEVIEYLNNLGIEYRFGCYKEDKAEVCHLLGDFVQAIEGNKSQAYHIYKQNCDQRGFPSSCETTGLLKINNKADCGTDWYEGLRYLRKSCDLGWFSGCHKAGYVATLDPKSKSYPFKKEPPDFDQGITDLKKACEDGGIGGACFILSSFLLTGAEGLLKEDIPRGLEYAKTACEKKEFQACYNAARVYELGLGGIPKDSEKADFYVKKFDTLLNELKNPEGNVEFGA